MIVFVLGTGRCGSTLVHEVLARHPEFGFLSNIDDNFGRFDLAGRWNNTIYRRVPPVLSQKGRIRYAPSEGYQLLDKQVAPILSTPYRDLLADDLTPWLQKRLHDFFERRIASQRKPVFLHKFTGWPRSGLLQAAFPEAKFINIIRDGRAVANSWIQMPWWKGFEGPDHWQFGPLPADLQAEWDASGRSFVLLAGLAWRLLMDSYEEARSIVPEGQWVDVRYEDVLADSHKRFNEMLEFAGVSWNAEFERGFGQYTFGTSRSEAFRQDLDPRSLRLLDGSLGSTLERHGYSV